MKKIYLQAEWNGRACNLNLLLIRNLSKKAGRSIILAISGIEYQEIQSRDGRTPPFAATANFVATFVAESDGFKVVWGIFQSLGIKPDKVRPQALF